MLSTTAARVPSHTAARINREIHARMTRSVAALAGHPERIADRLRELDAEWDIERVLEANAASIGLIGLALGAFVDRRFFAVPALVSAFLLQHALQGWCPPLPVLRRLGFRTEAEIWQERTALKALRGDFKGLGDPDRADGGQEEWRLATRAMLAVRA
jgi:hypothetical protein